MHFLLAKNDFKYYNLFVLKLWKAYEIFLNSGFLETCDISRSLIKIKLRGNLSIQAAWYKEEKQNLKKQKKDYWRLDLYCLPNFH